MPDPQNPPYSPENPFAKGGQSYSPENPYSGGGDGLKPLSPGMKIGEPWLGVNVPPEDATAGEVLKTAGLAAGHRLAQVPGGLLQALLHPLETLKNIPSGLMQTGKDLATAAGAGIHSVGAAVAPNAFGPQTKADALAGASALGRSAVDIGMMMAGGRAIGGFTRGIGEGMTPDVPAPPAWGGGPKMLEGPPETPGPKVLPQPDLTATRDFARDAVKNAPPKQPVTLTVPGQQDPATINKTLSSPAVAQQVMQAVSKGRGGEPNVVDPNAKTATQTTQPENLATESARVETPSPAVPMGGHGTPASYLESPSQLVDRLPPEMQTGRGTLGDINTMPATQMSDEMLKAEVHRARIGSPRFTELINEAGKRFGDATPQSSELQAAGEHLDQTGRALEQLRQTADETDPRLQQLEDMYLQRARSYMAANEPMQTGRGTFAGPGDRPLTEFETQQMRQFMDEHPGKGYLPESEMKHQFYDMLSNRSGFLAPQLLTELAKALASKGLPNPELSGILSKTAKTGAMLPFMPQQDTSLGIGAR